MISSGEAAALTPRLLKQCGLLLVSAVLIGTGYALWQDVQANLHTVVVGVSLSCYVFAFGLIAVAFLIPDDVPEWIGVVALAYAFAAYAGAVVQYKIASYGTDSLLFNAYSAKLLVSGIDPYTRSMEPAYRLFSAPLTMVTPTAQGGGVYVQSYPALAFLIYLPLVALHIGNLLWLSVVAHLAVIFILAWCAPKGLRAILPLGLFVAASYMDYSVGGVTDILWVPAVLLCARYWHRDPVRAAIWLGLACSMKQTPWFIVPFALIAWAHRARLDARIAPFFVPASILAATFLVPNLPFALWHPAAWFRGVTEPMSGGLIAFGSGLIQLTTSQISDAQPSTYQMLSVAVLVILLSVYAWQPQRARFLPFIAPAVVLFFSPRSLQNYFMYWPLILLAYVVTPVQAVAREPQIVRRNRTRWIAGSAIGLVIALTMVAAVRAERQRVSVSLGEARIDQETQRINRLRVTIRNDGDSKAVRFAVFIQGQGTAMKFWNRGQPARIAHGESTFWLSPGPASEELSVDGTVSVQVVAIDAESGNEAYSNPRSYVGAARRLLNGDLARWTVSTPTKPLSWATDGKDFASKVLRRVAGPTSRSFALAYNLPKSGDGVWRVASISQRIPADIVSFRVQLRPDADYSGDVYPRAIFGLEIIDALGRHLDIAIDSRLHEPKTYERDTFTYLILPGKLHAWNAIDVDLRVYREKMLLTDAATLNFTVIGAVHSSFGRGLSGEFGGVTDVITGSKAASIVR